MAGKTTTHLEEREDSRMVLYPLAKELRRLVKARFGSNRAADRTLGLPENTTQRITSSTTQSFDYRNVTKLLSAVGMTPNEAAALVGLYENIEEEDLTPDERVLLKLFREPTKEEDRRAILVAMQLVVSRWKEQLEPVS